MFRQQTLYLDYVEQGYYDLRGHGVVQQEIHAPSMNLVNRHAPGRNIAEV